MNRKRMLYIMLIALAVLIVFVLVRNPSYNSNITADNDPIEELINSSLSIQYDKSNTIDLYSVYTSEFIEGIDNNSNFYKNSIAPYKIVFRNYKLNQVGENEYVVGVHIKDKQGSYIQVIHLKKQDDGYLISEIEYDI